MRIGIVTITELDNFGNRLQNYALQTVLKQFNATVETIPNYIIYKYRKSKKYQFREFFHGLRIRDYKLISSIMKQYRFEKFDKKYFEFSKAYSTIDYISPELNESFDYFVAGSDQIWNPYFPFNREFNFLTFADPEKRISYSASFGVDYVPEDKQEKYKQYLSGMKHISVREYAGQRIIQELLGITVPVLLDPTLLLSRQDWEKIERKPRWIVEKSDYILTYFLGKTDNLEHVLNEVYTLHSEYGRMEIIDIHDPSKIKEFSIRPDEFIWLIHHAKLIVTDSFHGTVFSILMEKPFVTLRRKDEGVHMNSRIESLFDLLEIDSDNLITTAHIENLVRTKRILDTRRREAIDYLAKVIERKL